jgi:hypothetical protein
VREVALIDGRTPLPALTPPSDLWRILWSTDGAAAAALLGELDRARTEKAKATLATRRESERRAQCIGIIATLRERLHTHHYSLHTERPMSAG